MTRRKKLNLKTLYGDLTQWLIFTVMMTVTPILVSFITLSFKYNQDPDFNQISLKGELLVASVAIVAEACSDMFKKSSSQNTKVLVGGMAVILLIFACSLGTAIQENQITGRRVNDFSTSFFGACVLIGAGVKIGARV